MDTTLATRPGEGPFGVRARSRGWNAKRRRNFGARYHHHIPGDYASSEARRQKLISTPPLMHVMKYMVPLVLAIVTLKYQDKTESLFLENRALMWCFVAATCVYWLIVEAMKQMTTLNGKCFRVCSRAALTCGAVSAVSLVSMFLFSYPASLMPLVICIPVPLVLAWPNAFRRGIEGVRDKIHGMVVWDRGCSLTEEASLPV